MTVIRARVLGFCMGVRRAVEMAEAELARRGGKPGAVYSLGPLIHNPQTLAALEERGLSILDERSLDTASLPEGAAVIIRAHGVTPAVETALRESRARIVDATCPRVRASQETARRLAGEGRRVFIAGEKDHAEVRGVAGHAAAGAGTGANGSAIIAGNAPEAERAARELRREQPDARAALVAQTTFSSGQYAAVAAAIRAYFPNLEVKDTICPATRERQDALRELCAAVDAVVAAGGKESANTRRLAAIARDCGKSALIVESAADLAAGTTAASELAGCNAVGLCAGASTPDDVIDEVERALRAFGAN